MYSYQPDAGKNSGAAVVLVPGVPFIGSNDASDGAQLARWLNERGIAAFVLRHRTASTEDASIADVNRAVRLLRARAGEWRLSPKRIAVLGLAGGAQIAADAVYNHAIEAKADASDPVEKFNSRPDLLALIWGARLPTEGAPASIPTFLTGSARTADGMSGMVDLWMKLRAARVSVDGHFFAQGEPNAGLGLGNPSLASWREMFFAWARFQGLLTDEPRVPIKGMVYLDGRVLPHGYVILTPVDFVGAGPIVARVFNSTANIPIGQFSVPANQGPIAGRYKVDVRQNMNRWLSNSFSGDLVVARGGAATPEQAHFGHHRVLAPSIEDQRSFTKVRPTDKEDYVIEIKPGADTNLDLRIEVFTRVERAPAPTAAAALTEPVGGIVGGPKNPGQIAYVEQIKAAPGQAVPGIPEPILLWPNGAPEAVPDANGVFTDEDKPALYAFPASASHNTGAGFLVIPGGAFTNRGMDSEGVQIAKFLNRHGISGFVLRYRIGPNYPRRTISTMDGQRALRFIRAHAAEYKISPDRIGTIGFSAGAELQGDAFYNGNTEGDPAASDPIDRISAAANFNALIYGGRNLQNPASAAPTFLFNTVEDAGHLNVQVSIMNALRQAGVPVEAHFYQVGPHGSTMSPGDPQLGQWPDLMVKWLQASRIVPIDSRPGRTD